MARPQEDEKLCFDYEQYHGLIDAVIHAVNLDSWKPDLILGVSRGGLMLADGLSRGLSRPMGVIAVSSYSLAQGTQKAGELEISSSIASVAPVAGRVLIADDLADSGHTFTALLAHLRNRYPAIHDIRTAAVWMKSASSFKPDYYAQLVDQSIWIVQPFEVRDFN